MRLRRHSARTKLPAPAVACGKLRRASRTAAPRAGGTMVRSDDSYDSYDDDDVDDDVDDDEEDEDEDVDEDVEKAAGSGGRSKLARP